MSDPGADHRAVLVVSPHPDDLEIGCGGTVAKLRRAGRRVVSVVVTDGRRSPRAFEASDDEMAAVRRSEVMAAARLLDLDVPPQLLDLPDVRTEENRQRARDGLAALLRAELGDHALGELLIPHPELDRHETHRVVARLALDALASVLAEPGVAAARSDEPPSVWCYEVWSPFPAPDRLEDVSEVVEIKRRAIEAHASQCRDKDYAAGALGLMRYRAVFAESHALTPGMSHAEAFLQLSVHDTPPAEPRA